MDTLHSELITPQALAADAACLALIASAQAVAGARCVHMDFEPDAAAIALEDAATMHYAVARDARQQPLAVIGVEVDDEARRAWLRGPFSASADFAQGVDAAWTAALGAHGSRADRWDGFIETSHQRALAWYAASGFVPVRKHSNYIVRRDDARFRAQPEVVTIAPGDDATIDAVTALAQRAFPGGYLGRDDFAAAPSDVAVTWVLLDGRALVGYIRATYEPGASEVFIENLAVVENQRRRGGGRLLLNAALHWAFALRDAPQVGLTVKEGNSNAEQLYQSAGFHLLAEGQHLRLDRPRT